MKSWLLSFGIALTIIFGGGFLLRLVRDGDFYVAEFIGGIIGIVIMLFSIMKRKK